jgi:murein DD-endopeptidase MepM/ murein hydrolase activator NlpD
MHRTRRRRLTTVAVALAATLAAFAAAATPARAQTDPGAPGAVEGLTPEDEAAFRRYDANATAAAELGARVDQASLVLLAAESDLAASSARALEADRHLADVNARIADAERRLTEEQARLRSKAIRAYIGGREEATPPVADMLASTGTLTELGSKVAYSAAVVGDQQATVGRVTGQRDEVRALKAEAEEVQATATAERDAVTHRRDDVRRQHDELEQLHRQAADRAAQDEAMVTGVSSLGQSHALRTSGSRAAGDSIAGLLLRRQYGEAFVQPTIGILSRPVIGAHLSSGFGTRADPMGGGGISRHEGIDFAAPEGTPLTAPADGIVVIAGEVSGYGNATVIDHGNGIATLLGHQSAILVTVGQLVARGDLIGRVGSTGNSTGPHLHLEVRLFGVPEDPRPYLGG